MKLEEEIKQKRFDSEQNKLVLNILFTSGWLKTQHIRFFKTFDLTPEQYNVLRILRGQYPNSATCGTIIERMLDRSSNITRLLDKLVTKGLVTRTENKENRRMQSIIITDKGLKLLERIKPETEMMAELMDRVSKKEAMDMNDILDKMRG